MIRPLTFGRLFWRNPYIAWRFYFHQPVLDTLHIGFCGLPDSPLRSLKTWSKFARAQPQQIEVSTLGAGGFPQKWRFEALSSLENVKNQNCSFCRGYSCFDWRCWETSQWCSLSTIRSTYGTYLKAKKVRLLAVGGWKKGLMPFLRYQP